MQITVPFIYHCPVREPRKVNFKNRHFGDVVTVEVPDIATHEAPVALIVTPMDGESGLGPDGVVEIRFYDGQFWVPSVERSIQRHPRGANVVTDVQHGADVFDTLDANPLVRSQGAGVVQKWLDGTDYQGSPSDFPAHHDYASSRADEIEWIEQQAKTLLVIDGTVWTTTRERVLSVHAAFLFGGDRFVIEWTEAPDGPRLSPSEDYHRYYFRADRLDDAISFANELKQAGYDSDASVVVRADGQVLMPETLKWEDDLNDLCAIASFVMGTFTGSDLMRATEEQAVAWIRLRDLLGAFRTDMSEENATSTMAAMETFMQVSRPGHHAMGLMAAFTHRWAMREDDRTYQIDEWTA